jgi:hypothetical protein
LQKLHRLTVVPSLVHHLGEVGQGLGVIGVQDTAGVNGALLCKAKIFESVGKGICAEKHGAVVQQHAHVLALQRGRLAHRHAIGNVRRSEWCGAAATQVEVSSKQLDANLEQELEPRKHVKCAGEKGENKPLCSNCGAIRGHTQFQCIACGLEDQNGKKFWPEK